ncbi:MAG: macro domain-containing protein [Rhodothermales bacterium]
MTTKTISGATIQCRRGNIVDQPDIDAIVNAANAQLRPGGGVAGAIHRAAGPGLDRECRPLAPIQPGQAVITGAHNLPNQYVVHCLGPVYGRDEPADQLLASCYREAIRLAEEHALRSVAFPSISTGAFGYPLAPAARIAIGTVLSVLEGLSSVTLVRIVLFSTSDLEVYEKTLVDLAG